ncbi:MAG: c-type cytochrome [Betaproteobacteria bacterium]
MRNSAAVVVLAFALFVAAPAVSLASPQHGAGVHRHPDAARLKNPVSADAASIEAGKKTYVARCAHCHGATGVGDGEDGLGMDPPPANLTDATWKHGPSDGEIFTVIRSGVKGTGMKGFGSKLTTDEIWNLVNYLRSIGPHPQQ